eukprot:Skav228312  [mRNA]  locus=scaffold4453:76913:79264:+ [translate_table: standard]
MARYAIFLEEVKFFLNDNQKYREDNGQEKLDLVWLLRAAHQLPGQELNGKEDLKQDTDEALLLLVTHLRDWEQTEPEQFRPLPTTEPKYFPLVYVVPAVAGCEHLLKQMEELQFTRGGIISVLAIPDRLWSRDSSQDANPEDKWAWGTLMPLYFREIGQREKQWLVSFFGTRWNKGELVISRHVDKEFLRDQWNADSDKLFARHVALALVHPISLHRVLLLVVFQQDRNPRKPGAWAVPGGSVDRAKDKDWLHAAMREFEEEVNPSGLDDWSANRAFDPQNYELISLQNLMKSNIQNMSRPCLNFLVARATPTFFTLTQRAPAHPQGAKQLELPADFVTELRAPFNATDEQKDMRRYWHDKNVTLVEHDRFKWLELDLTRGEPLESQVHPYVRDHLAKALQENSAPRRSMPSLTKLLQPEAGVDSMPSLTKVDRPQGEAPRASPYGDALRSEEVPPPPWNSERQAYEVRFEKQATQLFQSSKISMTQMKQAKGELKKLQAESQSSQASCVVWLPGPPPN